MGTTADKLAYLQGAKEAIREAIESLGGTVPDAAFGLGWGLFLIGCILLLYGKIKRFGLIL